MGALYPGRIAVRLKGGTSLEIGWHRENDYRPEHSRSCARDFVFLPPAEFDAENGKGDTL